MKDWSSNVEGYERLTEHERENFTADGFVLYRAESLENLLGDIYTEVCTFPDGSIYDGEIEFHSNKYRDKVEEIIDFEEAEINLSNNNRDHWQFTSYGVNPDELREFAELATEKTLFETTENPTPVMVEMVVPYSEVEFDLPKDSPKVTSEAISRCYAEKEKEYRSHYKTPVEWINSVTILDLDSGQGPEDHGLDGETELQNTAHNPNLTQDHYDRISWELSKSSLEKYPENVQRRANEDSLQRKS